MGEVLEKRVGAPDAVLGVLAVASQRLGAENPNAIGFSMKVISNCFRKLRENPRYAALQPFDFVKGGDAWRSNYLDNLLLKWDYAGVIEAPKVSGQLKYYVLPADVERIRENIAAAHGPEALGEIEAMAEDFWRYASESEGKLD